MYQTIEMKKRFFLYRFFISDIALALLVFGIVVFVSYRQTKRANDTAKRVANTLEILFHKEKLVSFTTDHETGSRAFILTGSPEFLDVFQRSKLMIPPEIRILKSLTTGNSFQQTLIDSLAFYFTKREVYVDSIIHISASIGAAESVKLLITGKGKTYMGHIRRLLDQLQAYENALYIQRKNDNENALDGQNKIFLSIILLSLVVLVIFSWRERRKALLEERKRLQRISESEQRFRALVENNENIIALFDNDMNAIYRSPASERITGWTNEERLEVGVASQTHPEDIIKLARVMQTVRENPGIPVPILLRTRHKDSHWIWLDGMFNNLFHDPAIKAIVVNLRDVTEAKTAQEEVAKLNAELEEKVAQRTEQLQNANSDMEAFTYSVSHDLRAPLRIINGFTAILEEEYTDKLDDEAKRLASIIKKNTTKMGSLIDGLLDFSRMRLEDIRKTVINTQQLVEDVVGSIAADKKIKWKINTLPDMYAETNSIRQVWVNLISNAVKYSSPKEIPVIEIGAYHENGFTIFFVKDNGVGFNEDYKDRLFKVFQRLHSPNEFEGTGIGLALIHKIITKHGGKVWAEGMENIGAGFFFSLPKQPKI